MTQPEQSARQPDPLAVAARARQAGGYEPPILDEPDGGPIPEWDSPSD